MKKEWLPATLLTLLCIVLINGGYTAMVWVIAQLTPDKGLAARISVPGERYYYDNIAQKFTVDRYFWPRPSAVDYNAAGSGGSNKGPTNPDFLKTVAGRIDSFVAHNPTIARSSIPAELVTASGSGLDPDISPASAYVQAARVAKARGLDEARLRQLINLEIQSPFLDIAPKKINVLRLNMALDALK